MSCPFYVSFVDETFIFLETCPNYRVFNFDCDFSLVHDASDLHYNFQTEKEILSCPFFVNFIGETFIFLRDMCKLQSVVNFEYDFSNKINKKQIGRAHV